MVAVGGARVTGEPDGTPAKALGPVTQLLYGVITPGNLSGNIMSANVTGGIGLHAADLLTTLKTGWMLGGSPRVQFYAQLFGVVAGALVVVPVYFVLIPSVDLLGTERWPAPAVGASMPESAGDELIVTAGTRPNLFGTVAIPGPQGRWADVHRGLSPIRKKQTSCGGPWAGGNPQKNCTCPHHLKTLPG